MPINVSLDPVARFDSSLIRYISNNFERIRQGLASAIGGDDMMWGEEEVTVNHAAAGFTDYGTAWPRTPNAAPIVVTTPIAWTGSPNFRIDVKRCSTVGFDWRLTTDAAYIANMTIAWAALPRGS